MKRPFFTVIDVETTGLFPKKDRIVEIAAISLDAEGNILHEYETLLNPDRDLGPVHIHKITGAMVKNAPRFYQILGDLVEILAGTIIVGHNVSFDYRFLDSEFTRAGIPLPITPQICTLRLARKVDANIPSGKLEQLCEYYDIPLTDSHCAFADCEATAKLFQRFLQECGRTNILQSVPTLPDAATWPVVSASNLCCQRSQFVKHSHEQSKIAALVGRLPINTEVSADGELEYLNLLDQILADRRISPAESQLLLELAMDYQLSREQAIRLHTQHLAELIRVALLDGVITNTEMEDLILVAKLLDQEEVLPDLLSKAHAEQAGKRSSEKSTLAGKSVCFTGALQSRYNDMPVTREVAQKLALERGMIIKEGVSRKLDYLVTADPDSLSGKARKAREYDICILPEQAFWALLDIKVS